VFTVSVSAVGVMAAGRTTTVPAPHGSAGHTGGGPEGGECVEVATTPATVHVRDSKDQSGPTLTFSPAPWAAFVSYAADAAI
jgi:hypothetical protein